MRTSRRMELFGTPVAIMGPDGEWTEIGFITECDVTVETDEWMPWETPFKVRQDFTLSVDAQIEPQALNILVATERATLER